METKVLYKEEIPLDGGGMYSQSAMFVDKLVIDDVENTADNIVYVQLASGNDIVRLAPEPNESVDEFIIRINFFILEACNFVEHLKTRIEDAFWS